MNTNKKIVGNNFRFFRKECIGATQEEIAKAIGVSRPTVGGFEIGRSKYFNLNIATRYFNYICELPSFPKNLTLSDFIETKLTKKFFIDRFSKITTDNFSREEVSENVGVDISTDTSTMPAAVADKLSPGLQEFLNNQWEMAGMNPTEEEIEMLKELNPKWRASKEYFRFSLQDLRRSKKHLKRKATADSGQSSAG